MHLRLLSAALAAAVALQPALAAAYIMPAEALARQWSDRRAAGWRDASLRLAVQLGDGDGGAPAADARLLLKRPERARWQPQDRRQPTVLDVDGRRSRGVGHHIEGDWQRSPSLWLAWLLPRGRKTDDVAPRLLAALKSFGVDHDVVSLGRFAGGLVYIVGAAAGDLAPPQLWLDKDTLLPVRTLVDVAAAEVAALAGDGPDPVVAGEAAGPVHAAAGLRLDTRLVGWGAGAGGARLPAAWEFYLGERRLQRWEVRAARQDSGLGEALFAWGRGR